MIMLLLITHLFIGYEFTDFFTLVALAYQSYAKKQYYHVVNILLFVLMLKVHFGLVGCNVSGILMLVDSRDTRRAVQILSERLVFAVRTMMTKTRMRRKRRSRSTVQLMLCNRNQGERIHLHRIMVIVCIFLSS